MRQNLICVLEDYTMKIWRGVEVKLCALPIIPHRKSPFYMFTRIGISTPKGITET
jgi:hypothetical protein